MRRGRRAKRDQVLVVGLTVIVLATLALALERLSSEEWMAAVGLGLLACGVRGVLGPKR